MLRSTDGWLSHETLMALLPYKYRSNDPMHYSTRLWPKYTITRAKVLGAHRHPPRKLSLDGRKSSEYRGR